MPYVLRLNSEPEGAVLNLRADESWSPVVSYDGSDVVETIPVVITGDTDDDQALNMQTLHYIQENVRYYTTEPSSQHTQETWLEWQMANEGDGAPFLHTPRRRLVKSLEIAFDNGMWFTCGEGNITSQIRAVLTMTLTGWWESSISDGPFDTTLSDTIGDYIAFPNLEGDAPARLLRIMLSEVGDSVYGAYVGFRSEKRHGTLVNFVPLWEWEDGTGDTDTAAAAVAGASPVAGNNCMATTFATDTSFVRRAYLNFSDVTANFSDNYGRYVVLYRGKVDAATTSCTVRVNIRNVTATAVVPSPALQGTSFTVDNDMTWRCFNTGLIAQIPPTGTHTAVNIEEIYGFSVTASRESAGGTLYSDCLILVPVDEYMIYYLWNPANLTLINLPPGDEVSTQFYVGPDGSSSVYLVSSPSSYVLGADIPFIEGDGPPPLAGAGNIGAYFTIFNTNEGDNTLTNNTTVAMSAYRRYHSLQGDM